ncbi:MAG: MmgE/PrpD family protein [Pelagimonas sp.]
MTSLIDTLIPDFDPTVAARDIMRLSLLDWLACGIAGKGEPVAELTRAMVRVEGGAEQASLFGGGRAPMRAAALVNGATSHALDYDDTHFAHIGHPSVAVLPAAMAVAEHQGRDFKDLIEAALYGCEASVRMGLLLGRSHYQVGFHQTATAGAFGATVAAARLMGLDEDQTRHALALVSTRASGLKSQFGTMGKPYNAGIAASNGVEAALLASKGFMSNPDALEGANGFLTTHHADPGSLPQDWLMAQVSHKFHACCHGLHATLEALESLKPLDVSGITAIKITTHSRWMTVCNLPEPSTGLEAKFSYRMVTALSLMGHATAALATYEDSLCSDPQVIGLRDKVSVVADDMLSETEAMVQIEGATPLMAHHDLSTPLSTDERAGKLRHKAQVLLGDDRAWESVQSGHLGALMAVMTF